MSRAGRNYLANLRDLRQEGANNSRHNSRQRQKKTKKQQKKLYRRPSSAAGPPTPRTGWKCTMHKHKHKHTAQGTGATVARCLKRVRQTSCASSPADLLVVSRQISVSEVLGWSRPRPTTDKQSPPAATSQRSHHATCMNSKCPQCPKVCEVCIHPHLHTESFS